VNIISDFCHTSKENVGFNGCDYEEISFQGYKNPVRTSQETHFFALQSPAG
jgi:hypothetical protein